MYLLKYSCLKNLGGYNSIAPNVDALLSAVAAVAVQMNIDNQMPGCSLAQ